MRKSVHEQQMENLNLLREIKDNLDKLAPSEHKLTLTVNALSAGKPAIALAYWLTPNEEQLPMQDAERRALRRIRRAVLALQLKHLFKTPRKTKPKTEGK